MESEELYPCPVRITRSPLTENRGQRSETQTDSSGGMSGSVRHQRKWEEVEDRDYLRRGTSSSIGEGKTVIKQEPEDVEFLCEGTSSPVKHCSQVHDQNEEFQIMLVKEEESDDKGSVCTATACDTDDDQLQLFSCSWCSLVFPSSTALDKHFKTHHHGEYESVVVSGEVQHSDLTLSRRPRARRMSSESIQGNGRMQKVYHCLQCGNRFTNKSNLKAHQRIHTGEKPYRCSQCGKSFTRQSSLQQHHVVHTGEKPHQCAECGKTFTRQSSLQQHRRIHTGEKPHRCTDCSKRFPRQSDLQKHQRIHTGEKPYQCTQCGKRFSQKGNLQTHQQVHTAEKPYQCSQCGKSFTWQSTFHTHRRIHARKAVSLVTA